jgi:hypothetical protein
VVKLKNLNTIFLRGPLLLDCLSSKIVILNSFLFRRKMLMNYHFGADINGSGGHDNKEKLLFEIELHRMVSKLLGSVRIS